MPKKRRGKKRKIYAIAKRGGAGLRSAARRGLGGLSIQAALKNMAPFQIGMLAAKFAEKKGPGGIADDTDPLSWGWGSYLKGALGAFAAAFAANMIRPGWGQKVLEGGLNQVASRLVRNELIEKSAWAKGQFGQDAEEQMYIDTDGTPYLRGAGYEYLPLDEQHRMLPSSPGYYGDSLVAPGPLGDSLVRPGPLGQDDAMREYAREYQP